MPVELHVDDGADHLGDASRLVGFACGRGFGHVVLSQSPWSHSASAPEMISISSFVIIA